MEKDCYQDIIDKISKKLADEITSEEKDLASRTTLIDWHIADIVQDIGLKTCKQVLENKTTSNRNETHSMLFERCLRT